MKLAKTDISEMLIAEARQWSIANAIDAGSAETVTTGESIVSLTVLTTGTRRGLDPLVEAGKPLQEDDGQ